MVVFNVPDCNSRVYCDEPRMEIVGKGSVASSQHERTRFMSTNIQ